MRIDPKYFNRFIGWTALLTAVVIVFSTVRYNQKQTADFEQTLSEISFQDIQFQDINGDSLTIYDIADGRPAVVSFWSTWSEKSHEVNLFFEEYQLNNPDMIIIAAFVRDDHTLIRNYIDTHQFSYTYIDGTDFFQENLFPGLPAQLFFQENGKLFSTHIGNRTANIDAILNRMKNE